MKQVYVIHGYTASASDHWFPYLKNQLNQENIACVCLNMPNSMAPTASEWLDYLKQHIQFNEHTIVVRHSLINFLLAQQQKILSGIFVSGFNQQIPHLPELNSFLATYQTFLAENKKPLSELFNQVPCAISAFNDHIIPHQYTDALAKDLQADYIRLQQGGHFLAREGWHEFPLVLEKIKTYFKNE